MPSGNYAIKIDDRVFSMTIPQGRTAATYNRNNIDTQYYREQISEAIKVLKNEIPERSLGLVGFRQKAPDWHLAIGSSYGETGIGAAVFLPQDQTKSELYWADYRTLESLVLKNDEMAFNCDVHDE